MNSILSFIIFFIFRFLPPPPQIFKPSFPEFKGCHNLNFNPFPNEIPQINTFNENIKIVGSKPKIFDLDQKFEKKEFFEIPPFLDRQRNLPRPSINSEKNKVRPQIFKNKEKKDKFRMPFPLMANENPNFIPRNIERGLILPLERLNRENENNNLGFLIRNNDNNSNSGQERQEIPNHRKKEKCFKLEDIERCFSHAVFAKQKNVSETDEENKSCCICWCEFEDQEKIRFLPCLHRFHVECIDLWLVKHITCPYCKKDLVKLIKEGNLLFKCH
jgi:hypothetical protein